MHLSCKFSTSHTSSETRAGHGATKEKLKGNILTTLNDTAIQITKMKGKQVLILLLKYYPLGAIRN